MTSHEIDTINVDLAGRSYDIHIGIGLLEKAADYIAPLLKRPVTAIVTDDQVAPHFLDSLQRNLEAAGISNTSIVLPAGESTKSFAQLESLLAQLFEAKIERGDTIIALGGGVIGDLTGFAASIFRRGIDFIQVPTTLLAQVDSSVGGKTAINTSYGKNLIGTFHQPKLVLTDMATLDTLSQRQMLAGYAEVVKYGLINDARFFYWLGDNGERMLARDSQALQHAIAVSCRAKAIIVAADEREGGQRALLNLGHTFGHALEAATGYSDRLLHGEGVAMGMVMAFELSARLGLCDDSVAPIVKAHLDRVGLMTRPNQISDADFDAETLLGHMMQDKKVKQGEITFVVAQGIGQACLQSGVPDAMVKDVLEQALADSAH
ncbi:MAG: 3-dehydroquinate synthase [Alphaproteobacteria bacterium]|nr:MAG: 3-dehydroquinate synthase [Alphaproteobacteria bacterium]